MGSIYDDIGGEEVVTRLAEAWHARVLDDEVVAHAFHHGFRDDHTPRLAAYWAEAWGGPANYSAALGSESDVVRMHSGNGVHHEMDDRAIDCFDHALRDVGLDDPRTFSTLHDYFVVTTALMSEYPDSEGDVPAGLRLTRWSWEGLVSDTTEGAG